MQINPISNKSNLIVSLASTFGANPQDVINKIREINNPSNPGVETDLGSVFIKGIQGCAEDLGQKIGKLVLTALEASDFEKKFAGWVDNVCTSLKLWAPKEDLEKKFQDLLEMPLYTWEQYESLISRLQNFTDISTNPDRQTEERDLECKLIDYPHNAKPYIDAIFSREIGLQVTTFALKDGAQKMIFPSNPKETMFYNVTCSKRINDKKWGFIRIVFSTRVKDQIRKIHQKMLERGRTESVKDVLNHIKNSEYCGLIYDVAEGYS